MIQRSIKLSLGLLTNDNKKEIPEHAAIAVNLPDGEWTFDDKNLVVYHAQVMQFANV